MVTAMKSCDEVRLLGYVAKDYTPRPDGFEPGSVSEIASVSDCIASRASDWIDEWAHNDWFVYDTPQLAAEIAQRQGGDPWPMYAYSLLPTVFTASGESPVPVIVTASPRPPDFELLGWDVVSKAFSPIFECSPLSCNQMGTEVPVNSACLLSSCEEAVAFARRCAREQPEPGDYYVVEVWRTPPPLEQRRLLVRPEHLA